MSRVPVVIKFTRKSVIFWDFNLLAMAKAASSTVVVPKYRKYLLVFYSSFAAYFVLLVVLYLNGYFSIEDDLG